MTIAALESALMAGNPLYVSLVVMDDLRTIDVTERVPVRYLPDSYGGGVLCNRVPVRLTVKAWCRSVERFAIYAQFDDQFPTIVSRLMNVRKPDKGDVVQFQPGHLQIEVAFDVFKAVAAHSRR